MESDKSSCESLRESSSDESDDSDSSGYTEWEDSFPYERNMIDLSTVYQFIRRIYTNKTSVVYEAKIRKDSKKVALKIIDDPTPEEKNTLIYVLEKCNKCKYLPDIVAWHDLLSTDCIAVATKYIPDTVSIDKYCNGDENKIRDIISQTSVAVNFLHDKNIIHRDIKPSNILFDGKTVKLIDFDLSIVYDEKNKPSDNLGTTGFKAPEVDKEIGYSFPIDVYSLGIVLAMLLLEIQDYDITSSNPIISHDDIRCIASIRKSSMAYDLVGKMIKKNPSERLNIKQVLEHPFIKK